MASETQKSDLQRAEDAIAALLSDPTIYTTPAIEGVIKSLAAVRALGEAR